MGLKPISVPFPVHPTPTGVGYTPMGNPQFPAETKIYITNLIRMDKLADQASFA